MCFNGLRKLWCHLQVVSLKAGRKTLLSMNLGFEDWEKHKYEAAARPFQKFKLKLAVAHDWHVGQQVFALPMSSVKQIWGYAFPSILQMLPLFKWHNFELDFGQNCMPTFSLLSRLIDVSLHLPVAVKRITWRTWEEVFPAMLLCTSQQVDRSCFYIFQSLWRFSLDLGYPCLLFGRKFSL